MSRFSRAQRALPLALSAVLALGLLGGCASQGESSQAPRALSAIDATTRLDDSWSARVGAGLGRARYPIAPALDGSTLFAADERGQVMAFDTASGARRWQRELDVGVSSGLTAVAGQLYLGTRNGEVLALDQASGETLWRTAVASEVLAAPQPTQQLLLVQSVDGSVTALDRRSGDERWVYTATEPALTLRGTGTPRAIDPVTFVGLASGRLVTLDNRSGQPLWERRLAVPSGRSEVERLVDLDGQPLLTPDGRLFVSGYNGRLVALEATSGEILWQRELSSYQTPLLVGNRLFVVDADSHVIALDADSGAEAWRSTALERRWLTAPAFADGKLVLGDYDGYLHLLDARDGRLVGRTRVAGAGISVTPLTDYRRLYVLADNGRLEALELRE